MSTRSFPRRSTRRSRSWWATERERSNSVLRLLHDPDEPGGKQRAVVVHAQGDPVAGAGQVNLLPVLGVRAVLGVPAQAHGGLPAGLQLEHRDAGGVGVGPGQLRAAAQREPAQRERPDEPLHSRHCMHSTFLRMFAPSLRAVASPCDAQEPAVNRHQDSRAASGVEQGMEGNRR